MNQRAASNCWTVIFYAHVIWKDNPKMRQHNTSSLKRMDARVNAAAACS